MRGSAKKVEAKVIAQQRRIKQREVKRTTKNMERIKMEKELEMEKKREQMVINLFNRRKFVFIEINKFQKWMVNKDVTWAKQIGLSSLATLKLSLIQHLVKEFL
jgi:hypothetical protein